MQFPKVENAEQARVLGLMMSDRGFEMLMAERALLIRKLEDAGEHGDDDADNHIHLIDIACKEYVSNAMPSKRISAYNIYRLRPDALGERVDCKI